MASNRILYVCQEVAPYVPDTEGALLCRRLSQAMQERGNEIRTFMPRYGCINERRHQLHEVIRLSGMNLIIDDNDHQLIIKVASIPSARVQIYFIDNDDYFARKAILRDADEKLFRRQRRTGHLLRPGRTRNGQETALDANGRPLPRLVLEYRADLSEKGLRRRPDFQGGQNRRFALRRRFRQTAGCRNEGENRQRRRQRQKNCRSSTPLHTKTSAVTLWSMPTASFWLPMR